MTILQQQTLKAKQVDQARASALLLKMMKTHNIPKVNTVAHGRVIHA